MTKQNALTLHNYFSNLYRRKYGRSYDHSGKGIELVLLKRLLNQYDYYQLIYVIDKMVDGFVYVDIRSISDHAEEWIMEYAFDPLVAKARFAIRHNKGKPEEIKQLLYDYMDECDSIAPSRRRIEAAASKLQEKLTFV